ncbi:MAG: LamG domain-containing protein, partial [Nanoarchaeota archaeon]
MGGKNRNVFIVVLICITVLGVVGFAGRDVFLGPMQKKDAQIDLCGNGQEDPGENCHTCPRDFPCPPGTECIRDMYSDEDVYFCAPDCYTPIVVNDGDPYFTVNPDNPKWVWMLKNLNENSLTSIDSPTDISGPVIGVANNFDAVDLSGDVLSEPDYQDDWWETVERWTTPNSYLSLAFGGVYPRVYSDDPYDRGTLRVTTKPEQTDTIQAVGVPIEHEQYLSSEAEVVSVEINSEYLTPYENVPSIRLDWRSEHLGIGSGIWIQDENYEENCISYYVRLENVGEDYSIDFEVSQYDCPLILGDCVWNNCEWTELENEGFTIPLGEERTFRTEKIFNYASGFYEPICYGEGDCYENYKEWAVVYHYRPEYEELGTDIATYEVIYQPFKINYRNYVFTFYKDYYTDELKFLSMDELHEEGWSRYTVIDYYSGYVNFDLYKIIENEQRYFGVNFESWFYSWPDSDYYNDNVIAKFKLNEDGEIISLGDVAGDDEEEELVYYYNREYPGLDAVNIGSKNIDMRATSGKIIENPGSNSLSDEVVFYQFSNSGAGASVYVVRSCEYGWWCWGYRDGIQLGEHVAFYPQIQYHTPWLFDPDTVISEDWVNPLGLIREILSYSGQDITTHEAWILGTDTPRVESALTSGQDEYEDKVYVETEKGYVDGEFMNDGMKYIYAFEEPVDLTQLSETNKMMIRFLGHKPEIMGYVDEDSLLIKPYCIPECGNGIAEEGELCDGDDLRGMTCEDFGMTGDGLACTPPEDYWEGCEFDASNCMNPCGDGVINPREIPEEILLYHPYEGNANDMSGNGYDGVVSGATLIDGGRFGQAYSFDGADDRITVAHDESLNFDGDFTIAAWIKTGTAESSYGHGQRIISKQETLEGDRYFIRVADSSSNVLAGRVEFETGDGDVGGWKYVADNKWHHVAGVRDGNTLKVYVDGRLSGFREFDIATPITNTG